MTLHEAIIEVLKVEKIANAKKIAEEVNARKLYARKDGKPVPTSQIHARIKNYPNLFVKKLSGLYELQENQTEGSRDYQNLFFNLFNLFSISRNANDLVVILELSLWLCYIKWLSATYKRFLREDQIMIDNNSWRVNHLLVSLHNTTVDSFKPLFFEISNLVASSERVSSRLKLFIEEQIQNVDASTLFEAFQVTNEYEFDINTGKDIQTIADNLLGTQLRGSTGQYLISKYLLDLTKAVSSYMGIKGKMLNAFTELNLLAPKLDSKSNSTLDIHGIFDNSLVFIELKDLLGGTMANVIQQDFIQFSSENPGIYDAGFGVIPRHHRLVNTDLPEFTNSSKQVIQSETIYVESICNLLKSDGKAILVVPQSFLFNSGNSQMSFREKLISKDWIEMIISLPKGSSKQFSGIKQSLLVINKRKNERDIGKVHFINTNNVGTDFNGIPPHDILESIANRVESSSYKIVSTAQILNADCNLEPERYISPAAEEISDFQAQGMTILPLSEILTLEKGKSSMNFEIKPFLKISNLKNSETDYEITENEWSLFERSEQRGMEINTPLLLVAKIGETLKPTYINPSGNSIFISPNVAAFAIDSSKIIVEYLMTELHSDFFKKQFLSIVSGSGQPIWSIENFLRLQIRVPSIDEQEKILREKLEILHRLKQSEADKLAEKIEAKGREYSILSAVRHSLSQQFGALRNDVNTLKFFLQKTIDSQSRITWNSEISKRTNLHQLVNRMDESVSAADQTFEKIKSLIDINTRKLFFKETKIVEFIQTIIDNLEVYQSDLNIEIDTYSEIEKSISVDIDQFLLEEFFRNLLENGVKHGKKGNEKLPIQIIIAGNPETDKEVAISYVEYGKGLPEGFSFEDYISFGKRSGERSGTGLGGYILNQIASLHKGKLECVRIHPGHIPHFSLILHLPFKQSYD